MKILVAYYSGVGNTKIVATKISEILNNKCRVDVVSIEDLSQTNIFESYNALVIGFPTIHASPTTPIEMFIKQLKPLNMPIPAFVFTTCGLYSANTLRIVSKMCLQKNIVPILTKSYCCATTDGVLIAKLYRWIFGLDTRRNSILKLKTA